MSDRMVDDNDLDLDRTGTLTDAGGDLLDRLAEEFIARKRQGETPLISEFEARYPEHADRIRKFLPTVALIEGLKSAPAAKGGGESRGLPERIGEFRVVRELGRGGMGVVYEAVQESLGRHVAIKVIHHVHLDARRLLRFQRETRAVARLHHAHVVPIFGAGEDGGLPYYVMQYIPGSGLDALLGTWRHAGPDQSADHWRFVAGLGRQAAGALQYAHEQGILHRDIKPANLLVDDQQCVWVTDFGLAKLTGQDDLTASGDVIGTLRYLAPEALRGVSDERSDVYSLGLTLYEMLTLAAPFGDLSPSELLKHVSEREPIRPRRLDPTIPRDMETIVLKATAREPNHRYPTAGALADDLQRFLDDRPIRARPVSLFERGWRWARRNRATAALSATAALAVFVAAVVGWVGYAITTQALESESRRRGEAERATRRAEQNVALSLDVFAALFDKLTPHETLVDPPPGRFGGVTRRLRGDGPGGPGGPGGGPGGPGGDPFGDGPPPPPPGDRGPGAGRDGGPPPPPPDDDGGPRGRGHHGPGPGGEGDHFGPGGGRPGGARSVAETELLKTVLSFYDRFARQNATNPKLQGEAATAYRRVGSLYERLGQAEASETANARAVEIFEGLVAAYPAEPSYRARLVETVLMSDPWSAPESALTLLETRFVRARDLIDGLVAETPDDLTYAQSQVHVHAKLGAVWQLLGRLAEAETCYRRAIAQGGALIDRAPRPFRALLDRAMIRENLADLKLSGGHRDEAVALLDEAAADLIATRSARGPTSMATVHLENLAQLFEKLGESNHALAMTRQADDSPTSDDGPPPPPE